jgi:hypothetical protein
MRDPSHVRCLSEPEWRELFAEVGLAVEEVRSLPMRIEFEPWLERAGCADADAERVRELVADRIEDGSITLERIALKGTK